MDISEVKKDLIVRTKRGIAMFYVGAGYWFLMGLLSFFDLHINLRGLFYLIGAGMLFPLGILLSKLLKIDFIAQDNPLSRLSGVLGGMQMLFAPILVLIFMEWVEMLPFFIAVLTGAHFLPFSTLYNSKAYIFQAVAVVGLATVVGFFFRDGLYTILPFGLSVIYLITSFLMQKENRQEVPAAEKIME